MEFITNIVTSMPFQLLSSISIFLLGMHFLGEGLKNAAQEKLKTFFDKGIRNRFMGTFIGAFVTIIWQSSSATTVMVIGFINAGLMTLTQASGVIIGANIGTTLTGHIMAIRISDFIPLLMIVGGGLFLFIKKDRTKEIGKVFFGFGLLFMGLGAMSTAMRPLAQSDFFADVIMMLEGNLLLGILVGAAMTAILNSSSATTAIILSLATAGAINLNVAIPIVFGMNIGTCLTGIISSIGANKNAKRAAIFLLFFNIIGTLLFIPFVSPLTNLITGWGGEIEQQIANTHTFFNVVTALLILPFSSLLVKLVTRIIKDDDAKESLNPLDIRFLDNPAIAIDQALKESLNMHELAIENLDIATTTLLEKKNNKLSKFHANEKKINQLEYEIANFLTSIPAEHLTETISTRIASMIKITNDIERIGDHAKNIIEVAEELKDEDLSFSVEAIGELKAMFKQTHDALTAAYHSFEGNDITQAAIAIANENEIDLLEEKLREDHISRLKQKVCNARSGVLFLDTISNLERIGDHSKNIAEYVIKSNAAE